MSPLVFSICWNSNVSEALREKQDQPGKKQKLPSSMSLYRLPAEGALIKERCVILPQRSGPEVDLPTSNQAKIVSHMCALHF